MLYRIQKHLFLPAHSKGNKQGKINVILFVFLALHSLEIGRYSVQCFLIDTP